MSRGPFRNSRFHPPHEDAKRQSQESQTDLWTPLIGDACEVAKNRFRAGRTPSDPGPSRIGKNRRRPSRSRSTIRDLHSRANHHKERVRQAALEDTEAIPQHALREPCFRFKAIHTDSDRAKLPPHAHTRSTSKRAAQEELEPGVTGVATSERSMSARSSAGMPANRTGWAPQTTSTKSARPRIERARRAKAPRSHASRRSQR